MTALPNVRVSVTIVHPGRFLLMVSTGFSNWKKTTSSLSHLRLSVRHDLWRLCLSEGHLTRGHTFYAQLRTANQLSFTVGKGFVSSSHTVAKHSRSVWLKSERKFKHAPICIPCEYRYPRVRERYNLKYISSRALSNMCTHRNWWAVGCFLATKSFAPVAK